MISDSFIALLTDADVMLCHISRATNSCTMTLLADRVRENLSRDNATTFLVTIDESLESFEQSGANVELINNSLLIKVYDNDCKYSNNVSSYL